MHSVLLTRESPSFLLEEIWMWFELKQLHSLIHRQKVVRTWKVTYETGEIRL